MTDASYNSPYTGAQLDETIRKITSNNIHTYTELFNSGTGVAEVNINSLPAGPDGTRLGAYDIEFSNHHAAKRILTTRLYVEDMGAESDGASSVDLRKNGTSGNLEIISVKVVYAPSSTSFKGTVDFMDITGNIVREDDVVLIHRIYRQDTVK